MLHDANKLLEVIGQHLGQLAQGNAVVGKPASSGDKHVVPLCELRLALGGGGGTAEGSGDDSAEQAADGTGLGMGGGAGASVKAEPIAVILVDGDKVTVERIG